MDQDSELIIEYSKEMARGAVRWDFDQAGQPC